jgi:hypothetical protein
MTLAEKFADDPLYKELGKIGQRQKSLRATGLLGYDQVLEAPEVLRRAPQGATDLQCAEAAQEAIIAAVEGIVEPERKLVAEAVFGIGTKFENELVKDRKAALSKEGIGYKKFRQLRPEAVVDVIAYLRSVAKPAPPPPPLVPTEGPDYLRYNLSCIQRDALWLHLAGIASLYIRALVTEQHAAGDQHVIAPQGNVTSCSKALFDAFISYISSSHYSFTVHRRTFLDWMATRGTDEELPWWLIRTTAEIRAVCPLTPVDGNPDAPIDRHVAGIYKTGALHTRDLYSQIWHPWYFAEWPFGPETTTLETLTAKSAAVDYELGKITGVDQRVEEYAMTEAFQAVEYYYYAPGRSDPKIQLTFRDFERFCVNTTNTLVAELFR